MFVVIWFSCSIPFGASGTAALITTAEPTLALPANQLYHVVPGSSAGYLVETDPAFASYRTWPTSRWRS